MKRKYTEISTIHKNNSYTLQFDVTANKPICIQQLKSDPTFVSFSSIDVYCLTETKALLVRLTRTVRGTRYTFRHSGLEIQIF